MGFFSDLFDPGKEEREQSARLLKEAVIDSVTGVDSFFGGGRFGGGKLTTRPGALGGLREQLLSEIMDPTGMTSQQALGGLFGAAGGSLADLGDLQFSAPDQELLGNLRDTALGQFGTLAADPAELGAERTDILRQLAAPDEQRARVGLQDNLFAQGRLGSTGGALQQQALAEAQARADLERQLAGQDFGRALQGDALGRLTSTVGQMEGLTQGLFGRDMARNQMAGQRALDRFGIAGNLFDAARASSLDPFQRASAGIGTLGSIQGMGLNQFNTALNAAIARSNSQLGAGSGMADVAGLAAQGGIGNFAGGLLGSLAGGGAFNNIFGG